MKAGARKGDANDVVERYSGSFNLDTRHMVRLYVKKGVWTSFTIAHVCNYYAGDWTIIGVDLIPQLAIAWWVKYRL